MASSTAKTVRAYLDELPPGRRQAIEAVRRLVNERIPDGYEEGMEFGMISWFVPLERYPDTYNERPLSYVALANQKNHMSLYLMGVYADGEAAFREAYEATGKKLDMGKSCVRFKRVEDLPLEVIGDAVERTGVDEFIDTYERARA